MSTSKDAPFELGMVVITSNAARYVTEHGVDVPPLIERHLACDWGDLCDEDKATNDDALVHGGRLFSSYNIGDNDKLWIITEADRSSTTCLLPEDY